jgi:hypothetical protein
MSIMATPVGDPMPKTASNGPERLPRGPIGTTVDPETAFEGLPGFNPASRTAKIVLTMPDRWIQV